MKNVCLGRLPARRLTAALQKRALLFKAYADAFGIPPDKSDDWVAAVDKITNGDWGMDGNDQVGNCTCADCSHQKMLWTANTGTIVIPTTQNTIDLYTGITGYDPSKIDPVTGKNPTDAGANMDAVCGYLENTGYLGTKEIKHAHLEPTNQIHMKWGIQLWGSIKIGIRVPANAEAQFEAGKPWDTTWFPQSIEGGHDVCLVKYDTQFFYCVTWGKLQAITPRWLAKYIDEAIVPLDPEWVNQAGTAPSGSNLHQLMADMNQL